MQSSGNMEETRRKFTVLQQQRSAPPGYGMNNAKSTITNATQLVYDPLNATLVQQTSSQVASQTLSGGFGGHAAASLIQEPERTYVFPGSVGGGVGTGGTVPGLAGRGGGDGDNFGGTGIGIGNIGYGNTTLSNIPGLAIVNPTLHTLALISNNNNNSRGHARSISHGGGTILGPSGRPIKSAMKGHQRAFSQGQIIDPFAPSGMTTPRGHSRVGSKTDFILPPGHKDETRDSRDFATTGLTSAGSGRGHSRQASRSESIYTLRRSETPPWWKRIGICPHETCDERCYRIVVPNHTVPPKTPKRDHPNGTYVGNKIRTTKYTLLSFIPKNLLEQFHRVANLYFIFIVLLNWFPAINAFGKEVAMIPVLFVLGVTAIKDLFEDRRRRYSDKRINNTTCRVYDG